MMVMIVIAVSLCNRINLARGLRACAVPKPTHTHAAVTPAVPQLNMAVSH